MREFQLSPKGAPSLVRVPGRLVLQTTSQAHQAEALALTWEGAQDKALPEYSATSLLHSKSELQVASAEPCSCSLQTIALS